MPTSDKLNSDPTGKSKKGSTERLDDSDKLQYIVEDEITKPPLYPVFWSISLTILSPRIDVIIDITDQVTLGRSVSDAKMPKFVNLSPYGAHEKGVSRQHAILIRDDTGILIRDNNSSNYTLLNGKRLQPLQDYPLKPNNTIMLAKLELRFNMLFDPYADFHR
jgi:hypothetical protein